MPRVAKVATPATVRSPESLACGVPVPPVITNFTFPIKLVATLPPTSSAVTCTAGVIGAVAVVCVGCTVNLSCVADPGMMSKVGLVVPRKTVFRGRERVAGADLVDR